MKYFGAVGYSETVETAPGVFEDKITERQYYGDVIKLSKKWDNAQQVNDNIGINCSISVVADDELMNLLPSIKYVTYLNSKWKVTSIDIQRPRLILALGGLYNG